MAEDKSAAPSPLDAARNAGDADRSAALTAGQKGHLPDLLGLEWLEASRGRVRGRMTVTQRHMAPNGFLHAASVIALADSASGFTTIELKSNFLGTVREGGGVACEATLVHGGRNTQVWDAVVTAEATGKTIALFRCTQMVLYPKA